MTPEKIHLTKEKETMLMTLNARAIQSQWKKPILHDPWAEEAMGHIDYDMSKTLKGVSSWSMWNKICNPFIVKRAGSNVGGTGATYKWGLDDPQDIKQLEAELELIKEFKTHELVGFSRFPLWVRALFRAQEVNSTLRRMERIVSSLSLPGHKLGSTLLSRVNKRTKEAKRFAEQLRFQMNASKRINMVGHVIAGRGPL
jgi:hypothetical protein